MEETNIGGVIPFGRYHWRILDIKDNTELQDLRLIKNKHGGGFGRLAVST